MEFCYLKPSARDLDRLCRESKPIWRFPLDVPLQFC